METFKGNESEETTEATGGIHQEASRTQREGARDETRTQASQCDVTPRPRRVDSFTGQSQRVDTSSDNREIPAGAAGNHVAIALSELPNISLVDKRHLPSCQCVYLVCQDDQVLYIGQSLNLVNRWKQHHHYATLKVMEDVKIAWIEISDRSLLREIESALIEWFKPTLNKNPLDNLIHEGRPTIYSQPKKQRYLSVTNEGWEGTKLLVKKLGCTSISDFVEKLGRGHFDLTELTK
jgi:predicted GIY-YIG superfamily endonuclease